jgi:hypothetical protein
MKFDIVFIVVIIRNQVEEIERNFASFVLNIAEYSHSYHFQGYSQRLKFLFGENLCSDETQ